ncbi:MAG TPA: hypothetical protein PKE55_09360 [Kiritimatiellia bacterium]|nr:hypothetical protein [Kiritimatiellia bacterium]
MTSLARRLTFWILLIAFAIGLGVWTFYIPYQPRQLFRAIPGNAATLTAHHHLAGRWTTLLENPAGAALLSPLQLDPDILEDPGTQAILDLFARRDLLIAYVPELGLTGAPGLVLSGWLGGNATLLRWSSRSFREGGLIPLPTTSGWSAWLMPEPLNDQGLRFAFAIADGIAIGAISHDPGAIEDLLATYNGFLPSVHRRRDLEPWIDRLLASSSPDRGWIMPRRIGLPGDWPDRVYLELDLPLTNALTAAVHLPANLGPSGADPDSLHLLTHSIGTSPLAYAISSPALNRAWLPDLLAFPALAPLRAPLLANPDLQSLAAAVLHDDFSGRLKGIKIPTLLLALEFAPHADPRAFLLDALDRYNMTFPLSLVPRFEQVGPHQLIVIEGGRGNFYGMLGRQEQVAFVQIDSWLIAGSNALGLRRWLEWSAATGLHPGRAAEAARLLSQQNDYFRLGLDLVQGAQAARLALNAWSLKLLIENPFGSHAARQQLNQYRAWIDSIAPLANLSLHVTPQPHGEIVIHLTAGPQRDPLPNPTREIL